MRTTSAPLALLMTLSMVLLVVASHSKDHLARRHQQSWNVYFWSDPGCDDHRQAFSGHGNHACQPITKVKCISGYVSEAGFLAGGLSVCAYTGANCTGGVASLNDAAGSVGGNVYDRKEGFMKLVSWEANERGC